MKNLLKNLPKARRLFLVSRAQVVLFKIRIMSCKRLIKILKCSLMLFGKALQSLQCHTPIQKAEPKLLYVCSESYITGTVIHYGKTDAMFDYLDRVNTSYIMTQGSQKDYRAANNDSLSIA
jgi:hypothetical protein